MEQNHSERTTGSARTIALIIVGALLSLTLVFGGWPLYRVWQQGLAGQAALKRAEQDRQIAIREAEALRDSARLLAEAEAIRARGVQEANTIIADGLGGPEGYLRYLYIQALTNGANDIIYVPTEAALPILEAQRFTGGTR